MNDEDQQYFDQQMVLGALDSLGTALADHDHEWTEGERCIYEAAVECVLRANTEQCRLAASRGCAAAEGCAAPVAWKSVTSSYNKQPKLVTTFWCEQHAQLLKEN